VNTGVWGLGRDASVLTYFIVDTESQTCCRRVARAEAEELGYQPAVSVSVSMKDGEGDLISDLDVFVLGDNV